MDAELKTIFYEKIGGFASARSLTVAYPNVEFNPVDNNKYLAVFILPVDQPEVITVCGKAIYKYICQVSIRFIDDEGDIAMSNIVDELRQMFCNHKILSGFGAEYQVVSPPVAGPVIPLDGWFSIPVSFTVQTIH